MFSPVAIHELSCALDTPPARALDAAGEPFSMYPNLDRHLAWMRLRNLAPNTIRGRRRLLLAVASWLGSAPSRASAAQLAAWQAAQSVGPDCMHNYVSHLREFYTWLQAEGIRRDNPAARLVMPRLGRSLPRPIDTGDLLAAVGQAPRRVRPWLVLAAWAGFRCVEIALLRRESVRESAARPYLIVTAEATKGNFERTVPMCPTLLDELAPVLPRRGWVFPRADGQPGPNTPNRISAVSNDYLRGLGLSDTMHSLRHWFGTETYQACRDPRAVQELLGHRSLRSTEGYTKISDSAKVAAVLALPVGMAPRPTEVRTSMHHQTNPQRDRCGYCHKRIRKHRDGAWYHDHNGSVFCLPGTGTGLKAYPS